MKKINKSLLAIISILIFSFALFGCDNKMVTKSLGEAKTDINEGDYDKAQDALQNVLDQDSTNKEALNLSDIISGYLGAVDHFNDREYDEAQKEIDKLPKNYIDYGIKDNVENLKNEIVFQKSKTKAVDGFIATAQNLVNDKKYKEAEAEIKKIDVNSPSKAQKEKIDKLNKIISNSKK
ncbi:tetratricopeptide repeat protein [Clostridium sp.]|uniref:tetratricopeptide repeat protein n=1 Tax=Clostridium sp. TaxID=1506 RepID=UPI002FC665EF